MSYPDLHNYIKKERDAGAADEKIKSDLLSVGWHAQDIDEAFLSLLPAPIPASITEETIIATENPKNKDLHYLGIALALDVAGFGTCLGGFSLGKGLEELTIVLAGLVHLLAGGFATLSLFYVLTSSRSIFVKVVLLFLAVVIGGWGFSWGFIGLSFGGYF